MSSISARIRRGGLDKMGLVCLLVVVTVFNGLMIVTSWKEMVNGWNDFPVFYCSAQMVREGQSADLYNFQAENVFVHRVSTLTRPPNNHLPYELLLFVPLTLLSFGTAYAVWTVLGFFMLAYVAYLMRDLGRGAPGFWLAFLTILAFFPVWYCLANGQDSLLLLLLFAASFWFWRRGREGSAGFLLALALFRPQLALPFVFVATIGRKWKFLRGFVAGAALVGALSVLVVGWHGIAEYLRLLMVQGLEQSGSVLAHRWGIRPERMATWRGFLWIMLPAWTPEVVRNGLLLAGTFAGLLWAAKGLRRAGSRSSSDQAFVIAVAVVTLVSFHSFLNDFSLMVLPLLFLAVRARTATDFRRSRSSDYKLLAVGSIFLLTPVYLLMLGTNTVGLFFVAGFAGVCVVGNWSEDRVGPAIERYADL